VDIVFDLYTYGCCKDLRLPFDIGVLADLSGSGAGALPPLAERRFLEIDCDNFEERLAQAKPSVALRVPNVLGSGGELAVDLAFACLGDFSPDRIVERVPALATLLRRREQARGDAETIHRIDRKLSAQMDLILHHPDFQRLEATWRALARLVAGPLSCDLRVFVLSATKRDLLDAAAGAGDRWSEWANAPIFRRLLPFKPRGRVTALSCLIGDCEFAHGPEDVSALRAISRIVSAVHAPFTAGASPRLLGLSRWEELAGVSDVEGIFAGAEYAAWRQVRQSPEARYLALTVPRFLTRPPYPPDGEPARAFEYREDVGEGDASRYAWANAAYLMAENIARAFDRHGWPVRFRGVETGGLVEGLPCHTVRGADGEVRLRCPAEVAITERTETALAHSGLLPLCHWKETDSAVFLGSESLYEARRCEDIEVRANDILSGRLPYLLAAARFANYLQAVAPGLGGYRFSSRQTMEDRLNGWLGEYVNPEAVTAEDRAKCPLREANLTLDAEEGDYFTATLTIWPHFQLEGMTRPLRLSLRLSRAGCD
jgi:type VI secretion system protein ImpC